ncbi:hypothetical protein UlMin_039783 [Ulmus minor]
MSNPTAAEMNLEMMAGFVQHYYSIFDSNRAGLEWFYHDESRMNFEGQMSKGAKKLDCLYLSISTIDCQPSGPTGGFLVLVSGTLQLSGEQQPLKFSHIFDCSARYFHCYCIH